MLGITRCSQLPPVAELVADTKCLQYNGPYELLSMHVTGHRNEGGVISINVLVAGS